MQEPIQARELFGEGVTDWIKEGPSPSANSVLHPGRDLLPTYAEFGWNVFPLTFWQDRPTWPSNVHPLLDKHLAAEHTIRDPIMDTVDRMHAVGAEVHAVFKAAKRGRGILPEHAPPGTKHGFFSMYEPQYRELFLAAFEEFIDRYGLVVDGITGDYTRHGTYGAKWYTPYARELYPKFCRRWEFDPERWFDVDPDTVTFDGLSEPPDPEADRKQPHSLPKISARKLRWWDFQGEPIDRLIKGMHQIIQAKNPRLYFRVYDNLNPDSDSLWRGRNTALWRRRGWINALVQPGYTLRWPGRDPVEEERKASAALQRWLAAGGAPQEFHFLPANYLPKPSRPNSLSEYRLIMDTAQRITGANGHEGTYILSLQDEAKQRYVWQERWHGRRAVTPWSRI